MAKLRLHYSIAALLGAVTLICVILGIWFNSPPSIDGNNVRLDVLHRGTGNSYREPAAFQRHDWVVRSPKGDRVAQFSFVVLVPHERAKISMFSGGGSVKWQRRIGFEIGVIAPNGDNITPKSSVVLLYDARQDTVSLGDEGVPASQESVYVVLIDQDWQSRLVTDRGDFDSFDLPPDLREELSDLHTFAREKDGK